MAKPEAPTLVVLERPADLTTPVSVMRTLLAGDDPCFLLESIEGGARIARWSFLGTAPERSVSGADGDPFELLRGVVRAAARPGPGAEAFADDLPPFTGGAVGYAGYDAVRRLERLPSTNPDAVGLPDAWFGVFETVLAFDHVKHRLLFLGHARRGEESAVRMRLSTLAALVGARRGGHLLDLPGPPAGQPLSLPVLPEDSRRRDLRGLS